MIWPGQMESVVARAVNLSPTGILVDAPTPEPCPVGSPVVCDVPLSHGSLRLRGRVAHNRVLSPAKVGMGIAFTDLSPHMVAELRGVVDESEEKAQLVKLRFAGKSQLVCTRALPTAEGFQFTTALPFLRSDTEVEISLSPDASLATKGWVSSVALGPAQEDGIPRLVIDIRAGESAAPRLAPDASVSGEVESSVASPAPDLGAVPERVWEPWEPSATNDAPADLLVEDAQEDPQEEPQMDSFGSAESGGIPAVRHDAEKTEIIRIRDLSPDGSRPRTAARRGRLALVATALAVAAVAVIVAVRARPLRAVATRPVTAPVIVMIPPVPPAPAPAAAPVAPASPPIAETAPIVEPIAKPTAEPTAQPSAAAEPAPPDEAVDTSSEFVVGLVGSLKGAHRYVLHTPDGVAFNLPNAQATMKVGTYRPAVRGLRAVWVRELPGGGTHLRFFYTKSRPAPEVHLHTDGVRVAAR